MNRSVLPPDLHEALDAAPPDARGRMEEVWHLLGQTPPPRPAVPSDEHAWQSIEAALDGSRRAASPPRRPRPGRPPRPRWSRRRLLAYGTAALLAVLLLGVLWHRTRPLTVVAQPSARLVVALPDGSVAELNSGTRLRYRRGFGDLPFIRAAMRRVTLEGEAFFRVEAAGRPFVVETFNTRVEVLGTSFNVRARRGAYEQETHVAVVTGQVRVERRDAPRPLAAPRAATLALPGTTVRVAGVAPPQLSAAPDTAFERTLAWRANGFAAVERPLAAILAEVERRFALTITVDERVDLAQPMTAVYQREVTAEQILHDLCLASGLHYRRTSRGYALVLPARPTPPDARRTGP